MKHHRFDYGPIVWAASLLIACDCFGQSNALRAARTPERFFVALSNLIENGDLGDMKTVAGTFRLDLTIHSTETVFVPGTKDIEGISSEFAASPQSVETFVDNGVTGVRYGKFKPLGLAREKTSFHETLDEHQICVAREMFLKAWGDGVAQWNPSFKRQLTYEFHGRNELEIYLLFSNENCLHGITIFQNRKG